MGSRRSEEAPTSGVLLAVGGPLVIQGCRSMHLNLSAEKKPPKKASQKALEEASQDTYRKNVGERCSHAKARSQNLYSQKHFSRVDV